MALALYRKYRPRTFAEVIGQEHVTEPLMQALRSGRLNHAYLFSGPRGCGKTSSARILARSLNCEKGPTPEPCGECDSCVALAPDGAGSIDVIEIDAASHGGVDDARELRERAFFAPVSSRFKVYVIDEAHMVSSAGFNALLKLVEEPPEYVKFVFATTEPEKVLGTIKSRTHHYPFRLIPPGTLRPYLEELAAKENVKIEAPVFPLVVRAGGGSARDSLSVLDQLIAGAGPDGVTYSRAVALLGVTDAALLDEMCDSLAAGDGSAAYGAIDKVMEAGHDPRRFASDLLERFRDLIVLQQVRDAAAKGLLDYPADQLERLTAQAGRLGLATLTRCAGIVHDGLTEMRGTTAPRLLLEILVARMLLPGADDSTGALLQRMERLERRLGAASGEAPQGHAPPEAGAPPAAVQQDPRRATPPSRATATSQNVQPSPSPADAHPRTPPPPAQPPTPAQPPAQPEPAQRPAQQAPPQAQQGPPLAEPQPQHVQPQGQHGQPQQGQAQHGQPQHGQAQHGQPQQGQPQQGQHGQPQPQHAQPQGAQRQAEPHYAQPQQAQPQQAQPQYAQPQQAQPQYAQPPQAQPAEGGLDAAAVRRVWDDILTAVRRKSVREWAVAREATVRDVEGNRLILLFQHQVHANMLSNSPKTLADAVAEMIGGRWEIRCEIAGQSPPPAQAQPPPPNQMTSADRTPAPRPPAGAPTGDGWPAAAGPTGAPTGDDGWPAAAVPGGNRAATATAPAAPMQTPPQASMQAPTHAPMQSATHTASQAATQAQPHTPGHTATQAPGQTATHASAHTATQAPTYAATQAPAAHPAPMRAATMQATPTPARPAPGRPEAPSQSRNQPQGNRQAAPAWNDEPPPMYESDYGFDPGDEPVEEEGPVVRETSEEQALRLLREHLGAERID